MDVVDEIQDSLEALGRELELESCDGLQGDLVALIAEGFELARIGFLLALG